MNRSILWLDYSKKELWQNILDRFPEEMRDVYFSPEYVRLHTNTDDEAICFIYSKNGNIFFYPFLLREIQQEKGFYDISTPYGYGGPISNTKDSSFLKEAITIFQSEVRSRNVIAELIKFHPIIKNSVIFDNVSSWKFFKMCSTVGVHINIDENHRWKNIYSHANRKNINKAKRNNIIIKFGQADIEWEAFKKLYNNFLTEIKAEKFYYFSLDYYKNIRKSLDKNYVIVWAEINKQIISAMIVLLGCKIAHCHLIGTKREIMSLGVNNLLHHELILWCKRKGYSYLHIGGGHNNSENDSLLRFKKKFSNNIFSFIVGENVINRNKYDEICNQWLKNNVHKEIFADRLLKYRI